MNINTINDCPVIQVPVICDRSGNISVIENKQFPFDVKRAFWLYDVPGGVEQEGYMYKNAHQFIIAANGSFDVVLDDGICKKTVQLNRSFMGLHVKPGIWSVLSNFATGSVCLVLASEEHAEQDHIGDYKAFLELRMQ